MAKSEHSSEFLERKELIQLDTNLCELKHKYKMEELEFQRESDRRRSEQEKEVIRIKSAEIKRQQDRKDYLFRR